MPRRRNQSESGRSTARLELKQNKDGTYDVTIRCKKLKLRKRRQGQVLTLVDIEGIIPVEVECGNIAFKPKLILKMERRISKLDKFKIAREWVKGQLKPQII